MKTTEFARQEKRGKFTRIIRTVMGHGRTWPDICSELRSECQDTEEGVRDLLSNSFFTTEEKFKDQHSEVKKQVDLAIRHLENANFRLDRAMKYAGDIGFAPLPHARVVTSGERLGDIPCPED